MFTGIIEEIGKILSVRRGQRSSVLDIEGDIVMGGLKIGDSVSVNGACLTVSGLGNRRFTADVTRETLDRSALGLLSAGSKVNLERAMIAGGRFGGHIVSGHLDGTGILESIREDDNAKWVTIRAPKGILKYIVEKGSICVDGISLTVAAAREDSFDVAIIPHTMSATTLVEKKPGELVNLENDIIGKYVEKLFISAGVDLAAPLKSELTEAFLIEAGF